MYRILLSEVPEGWGGVKRFMQKDPVESGLFWCTPGESLPLHTHEEGDEYIYLLEGQARFVIGEEQFSSEPGELVKVPKGVLHRSYNTTDKPFTCFYLVCP